MSKHRHIPRRRRLQRQGLIPGTNRAAAHPWRERLRAAMDGKPTTKATKEAAR